MKKQTMLHGKLYEGSEQNVIIVLVRRRFRHEMCRYLVKHGVSAFAMDIDLPLAKASIDDLEEVCAFLKQTYSQIGLLCFETYSVYGLYGATVCPDISLVVASLPMDRVFESLKLGQSMLSYRGEDVPYQSMGMDAQELHHLHHFYSRRFHHKRYIEVYEFALLKTEAAGIISCHQINGDLYLFSSADDVYWNSREACRRIKKQLTANNFKRHFKHILYKRGAHDLMPLEVYNRSANLMSHPDKVTQGSRQDFGEQLETILEDWLEA